MNLQGLGRGNFQELPSLELETGDAVKSLSLNRSYCIAVLHAGRVVEWGMGICRERDSSPMSVPGSDNSTSNINSLKNSRVAVGRKGSQVERDIDIATQATAGASSAASSTMGTMRSSMALTRTIGMCPVRILSVACGGGHVVAIAEENVLSSASISSPLPPSSTTDQPFRFPSTEQPRTGVLTWGAGCSGGSGKGGAGGGSHVAEEQTQVLGLGGCGAANCWSCRECATAQSSEGAGRRESGPHWVKGLPQEARPVCVAAGDAYSAVVLEQRISIEEGSAAADRYHHDVWTWGIGGSGQLGIVAASTVSNEVPSTFSANCEARPIHIPITDDADSDESSEDVLAAREAESSEDLRKRRKVAKCDDQAHISAAGEVESCSVRDLSLGPYHAALVDARGRVFTWGSGAHGQLGHGDALDVPTPTLVRHLLGISMRGRFGKRRGVLSGDAPWSKHVGGSVGGDSCFSGIACGLWHTAVVSEDGALYAWGAGSFGQLGKTDAALLPSYSSSPSSSPLPPPSSVPTRGHTFIQTSPLLVSEIEDHVVGVVAGSRHTAAVISDKRLGHRLLVLGTIGAVHGGPEADMEREKVKALRCVSAVASGPWSIAVCSCSGAQ